MDTRRGFMKTGLGCIGLGGFVGTSSINAKTIQPAKVSPDFRDYEAGMIAGINAGKGGPFLGWGCLIKFDNQLYPHNLSGQLVGIDFKNKFITVQGEIILRKEE